MPIFTMKPEESSQLSTLSAGSYQILSTAIKHAKEKGHATVQSLHVAAVLLNPRTRSLAFQTACLDSLGNGSVHPLKCEALELCFKIALDRMPIATGPERCKDQLMSNALGAALKRAHANERKATPEPTLQPLLAVKTGVAQLTISILDDPSVSRVFREAGFCSTAVKKNMENAVAKALSEGTLHPPPVVAPGMRRSQLSLPSFNGIQSPFLSGSFAADNPNSEYGPLADRGRNGSIYDNAYFTRTYGPDPNREHPLVKQEETGYHQMGEPHQIWQQQQRSTHPLHQASTSAGPGVERDQSVSPVSEIVSPQEKSPRLCLPTYSPLVQSKWAPQQQLSRSSDDNVLRVARPLHEQLARGNVLNFIKPIIPKAGSSSQNWPSDTKRGGEFGASTPSWLRKDPGGNSARPISIKLNVLVGKAGQSIASMGTDLALGRSSFPAQARDPREEGQPSVPSRLLPPASQKSIQMPPESTTKRSAETDTLRDLSWNLSQRVGWQKEAVGAVTSSVVKCRSGQQGRRTSQRIDSWLMLLGPDPVAKREVAKGLAKLVFGGEDSLILLTGWPVGCSGRTSSTSGILAADSNGVEFRGKSPLDRLVEALHRKPLSVVLVEDFERVDSILKKNLMRAMERGRLADFNGKEVSVASTIVILTSGAGASILTDWQNTPGGQGRLEFEEQKLFRMGPHDLRVAVEKKCSGNVLHREGNLVIVNPVEDVAEKERPAIEAADEKERSTFKAAGEKERPAESILIFGSTVYSKRKAEEPLPRSGSPAAKTSKREESKAFSLDLNLSLEENLSEDEEPCITEELCETPAPASLDELRAKVVNCARRDWSAEMFALLDAAVVFNPFNLNNLTDWVLKEIGNALEGAMHTVKVPVEIDRSLLGVLVSSAWESFSNITEFSDWVDQILMRAISGLLQKGSLPPNAVLKLVGVERDVTMSLKYAHPASRRILPSMIRVDH